MEDAVELIFRLDARLAQGVRDEQGEIAAMLTQVMTEEFPARVHSVSWARASGRMIDIETRDNALVGFSALELSGLSDATTSFSTKADIAANGEFLKSILGNVISLKARRAGIDQLFIDYSALDRTPAPAYAHDPAGPVTPAATMALSFAVLAILFAGLFVFAWLDLKADNEVIRAELAQAEDRLQRKAHQGELRLNAIQTELDLLSDRERP